jgi:hypothetical protein
MIEIYWPALIIPGIVILYTIGLFVYYFIKTKFNSRIITHFYNEKIDKIDPKIFLKKLDEIEYLSKYKDCYYYKNKQVLYNDWGTHLHFTMNHPHFVDDHNLYYLNSRSDMKRFFKKLKDFEEKFDTYINEMKQQLISNI